MSEEMILYKTQGKVAYITFNRPKANAYNLNFYTQFYDAVQQANQNHDIGVVIINSSSPAFFCAGADIKEFAKNSTQDNQVMVSKARQTLAAMETSNTLFIAEISGHALGGGLEIIMACDLRFAAKGNYLLGLPEIKLGLIPGNGGSQRLGRLVSMSRAIEILATGDTFSIEEAEKWGLVNRLYEADVLSAETLSYASAAADGPLLALAATKKAVRLGTEIPLKDGLALEKTLSDQLYDTHDAKEGFNAFIEKRSPRFIGQ